MLKDWEHTSENTLHQFLILRTILNKFVVKTEINGHLEIEYVNL